VRPLLASRADDQRAAKAEELLASGGTVGVQSLNEFASVARRKLAISWKDIRDILDAICVLCPNPVPVTFETHQAALAIGEKYGYNIYDALLASAALEASCTTPYLEDLQDGQIINGKLTVKNPFREQNGE